MSKATQITSYEPDNFLKRGYWQVWKDIWQELKDNRWLTYQLFRRDFFTLYKQSLVGFFWVFILPLVSLSTFILLNQAGVLTIGMLSVPYPIYALLGLSLWQLFSTGIMAATNSLSKAGGMIVKINFSKKSLVISSLGQSLVSFGLQIGIVVVLFIVYRITPHGASLLALITVLPTFILTLGAGLLLAMLNAVFRDIGNILSVLINFLLFLTPILYSPPSSGWLALVTKYNPLFYLITEPRNLVLEGHMFNPQGYLISSVLAIVLLVIGMMAFHLTETRIAERV